MLPDHNKKELSYFAGISTEKVLEEFSTTLNGLTSAEVQKRILSYGRNTIKEEKRLHIVLQFLSNFKSPLVLTLFCVSLVSLLTGETVNAGIIFSMIFMSVILNFIQEYRASSAARKLRERIANTSLVVRDGMKREIKNVELCVGDIVELTAGDLIPADCRLLTSKDFFVNQSVLTGESFPVEKQTAEVALSDPELSQLINILFSGTSVVTGSATAVIVKVGGDTEFGKIAEHLIAHDAESEFTRGVTKFSLMILKVIIFFVIFIFFANALLNHGVLESLLFSLAVAVGLTPEFLPMIMSVTMGKGSLNMAKKGVIVKRLSAIPTFGSLDILCTDKTGTLTEDKIKLVKYIDINGNHSEKVLRSAYLNSHFQTGINNPMDKAVLEYKELNVDDCTKIDEIPFDFSRRKMSIVVEEKGHHFMITKGAPEEVLTSCKYYEHAGSQKPITAKNGDILMKQYYDLSNDGYRVLALAVKNIEKDQVVYKRDDEADMTLIGFVAFLDPPKEGVKNALDALKKMGVEVKILTGDNELVAQKICSEVGVDIKGVLLGREVHKLSDAELRYKVNDITIFARFSPDDKTRVIEILKEKGHVVGYMGDGINDAPSLKSADVGISVSNAVDVAKESADIILTEKSLSQLKDGVLEGRKTFGNTMKYIMMGISSNFGNMFSVLGAVLFLPFLPMLPIQILLNNFLYDVSQVTIPTDNVDTTFTQKPKRWNIKFIRNFMFVFGPISSFYDFATFFIMYMVFKSSASGFQTGWFLESLATQTLVIHVIRTQNIPFFKSRASKYLIATTVAMVAVGWLIPYSFLGGYFGFSPLPFYIPLTLAGLVVLYLLCVEIGKKIFYSKYVAAD